MMLADYVERASAQPWAWGRHDCCTFAGDWVRAAKGRDPMARWRGNYATEAEAEALIQAAGGLVALWDVGCRDAGMRVATDPVQGDVGVIAVVGRDGPADVGAIHVGPRWALLTPAGVGVLHPVKVKRAWRPCIPLGSEVGA